jgi:hypothetical protein
MSGTEFDDVFYRYYRPFTKPDGFDWVPVVTMGDGGGYDWSVLHAWYSPRERRYFWGAAAGCSCNDYTEYFTKVDDFENGDRPTLMAAARRFAEEYTYSIRATDLVDALTDINRFNPRKLS